MIQRKGSYEGDYVLSRFDHVLLDSRGLVFQVSNALSKLVRSSNTQDCDPIDDQLPTFESSPAESEQQLKENRVPDTFSLDSSFETINTLTRSHTASHTSFDDNLDNDFNAND